VVREHGVEHLVRQVGKQAVEVALGDEVEARLQRRLGRRVRGEAGGGGGEVVVAKRV
jgi:hypothetical protein